MHVVVMSIMKYMYVLIIIQTFTLTVLVDECTTGTDDCHADATCTDTDLSFNCTCNGGFAGDGTSCQGTYFMSISIK